MLDGLTCRCGDAEIHRLDQHEEGRAGVKAHGTEKPNDLVQGDAPVRIKEGKATCCK